MSPKISAQYKRLFYPVECSPEEKGRLKEILDNSEEISKDMKKFSNKLNKRFLLLRLLFQ